MAVVSKALRPYEPTAAARALQIWIILVGKAHSRQTMTYGDLAELLGYKGAGGLGTELGPIVRYCEQNDLPLLNVLVVGKGTGVPSYDDDVDFNQERERVFRFPWFDYMPPTIADFEGV